MSQQPFTELEPPKRNKELAMSVQWIDKADRGHCMHIMDDTQQIKVQCLVLSTWQCAICGQWTCDLHEHENSFNGYAICENCGKLSRFDQEQIFAFRERMNAL